MFRQDWYGAPQAIVPDKLREGESGGESEGGPSLIQVLHTYRECNGQTIHPLAMGES